jgi:integrase
MRRERANLTAAQIDKLKPSATAVFAFDAQVPGFGVRVARGGIKAYILQGRLHGRSIRLTIGDCRAWPLKAARQRASELKIQLDQGIDPREQEAEAKIRAEAKRVEARRQQVTLREAWDAYIEARRTKWSALHLRDHIELSQPGGVPKKRGKGLTQPGPLAALMGDRLVELTAERLQAWLVGESKVRRARTRLAFNLLRGFASWAEDNPELRGLIGAIAFTSRATRDEVPKKRNKQHDRLQREHLRAWFDAALALPSPVVRAYLVTLLLSGARPHEEWAFARWEDVRLDLAPSIRIHDKVEGERVIPLGPFAVSLLRELKAINDAPPNARQLRRLAKRGEEARPSEWVFASKKSASGRLENANSAMARICKAAGLPNVTLHGLRRTYTGMSEWVEMPAGVAAQIQGHKPQGTREQVYVHRPLDLLRMWHSKLEGWILSEAGVEFDAGAAMAPGLRLVANA